ncbi:MAG: hypothetical protein LBS42_06395 [Tannerella sp.]|nr:hypothetical protein [Tannerella sp.]
MAVTPKTAFAGALGAITVKYDGFTRLPYEPGTYTITVDIAEGATDGEGGVQITLNTDGSYTVVIRSIRQDFEPTITLVPSPSSSAFDAPRTEIWTAVTDSTSPPSAPVGHTSIPSRARS